MFRKYFKIEGSWRDKEIQWWMDKYPEIKNTEYILTEKIHGSNVSWIFDKDGNFHIAKRSCILEENDNFFNYQLMYEKYIDIILVLTEFVYENECTLNIYGEWFGKGIQKGVNYGPEKQLLFFDVIMNDKLLTPYEMEEMFSELNIEDMLVPNFGNVSSLREALDFKIDDKITLINPEGESIIEGIVIKPYKTNFFHFNDSEGYTTKLGSTFYLKKKNKIFEENVSAKKVNVTNYTSEIEKLKSNFLNYITMNRLNNIYSKYGEIQTDKDIGKYIKLLIEDAKEEFTTDYKYDIMDLTNKELKYIFNVGKQAVKMMK